MASRSPSFQTTRWSLVRSLKDENEEEAMMVLEQLCYSYWYPVYAFIRRSGHNYQDAEDLTQGFFAKILHKNTLALADQEKGKLRTFLLTCVQRYLGDEREKAMAEKRGAHLLVNFDAKWAENRYATELVDDLTPDRLFQRRWAVQVLEFALQILEEEYRTEDKAALFTALRPLLGFRPGPAPAYEAVAADLKMPLGTLKNHVSRLRRRWRELLCYQVSLTLDEATAEDIREELMELLQCV